MKALFALIAFAIAPTSAQTVWKLDKAHSQVNFTVSHMVFSEVSGTFKDFDVKFDAAKDDFTDAKIEATIKTGSVDTQNETRDKHVKSNDFLNAEAFPEMKFKSTKIVKTAQDDYKIIGDLTIRDITKPVVWNTKYRGMLNDPWGNTKVAFKATTTIDRFEFGTTWNKTIETGGLVAGKDIEITLLLEFSEQKPEEKKK